MKHRRSLLGIEASRRAVGIYAATGSLVIATAGFTVYARAGGDDTAVTEAGRQQAIAATAPSAQRSPAPSAPPAVSPAPARQSAKPSPKRAAEAGDCALPAYPTAACTGVPHGWRPRKTHDGDLTITKAGTVVTDYLVTGTIWVKAADVTIRRTRVYGSIDNFPADRVLGHLTIEDTEVVNPPGQEFSSNLQYAFGVADYTCRRCKVVNRLEGWRVGGNSYSGAGRVTIEDSYARLAVPPGLCAGVDPHGDGVQSYGGPSAVIRHNTIDQRDDPCPTAPIFIPDQDNAGGTVEDNLLAGGSYALRLTGGRFPSVTGNKIVDDTAEYGPLEVDCGKIGTWSGNAVVTVDWKRGTIVKEIRKLTDCG